MEHTGGSARSGAAGIRLNASELRALDRVRKGAGSGKRWLWLRRRVPPTAALSVVVLSLALVHVEDRYDRSHLSQDELIQISDEAITGMEATTVPSRSARSRVDGAFEEVSLEYPPDLVLRQRLAEAAAQQDERPPRLLNYRHGATARGWGSETVAENTVMVVAPNEDSRAPSDSGTVCLSYTWEGEDVDAKLTRGRCAR